MNGTPKRKGEHGGGPGSEPAGEPGSESAGPKQEEHTTPKAFDAAPLSDKIGDMLRKDYEAVVKEGIPDDFLALLKSADDASGGFGKGA